MIQYLLSLNMKRADQARNKPRSGSSLRLEFLEARYVFSGESPLNLEDWQSVIFDSGISGTLPFTFSRDAETIDTAGNPVGVDEPRFGESTLLTEPGTWAPVLGGINEAVVIGSGWDHDGVTPLAVLWEVRTARMTFIRGEDYSTANTFTLARLDLARNTVSGYRYVPQGTVVYEGLVAVITQRERQVGTNSWVVEGISFFYTQDYGQSFQRVEQVGGGYDVPAIAGGVSEGMQRSREWAFTNAFPETSVDDRLGAWFPWADYLQQTGNPKGGQIGLFRARRPEVGQPWVVEPNVLVYEAWYPEDAGGFHAHTAGMFADGLVSFWGDVSYRNRMVRHVAADLENYTTTTWTHEENFQGGWSPANAQVHLLGNQATSAAPGPNFGEVLVVGDEQVELIMKVQAPDELGEKAIISNLRGSFPGGALGNSFSGRLSLFLQHLPGVGYVATELSRAAPGTNGLMYSPDGENWTQLLNLGVSNKHFYGNKVIFNYQGTLHALELPTSSNTLTPLMISPGGQNLVTSNPIQKAVTPAGNTARRVLYIDGVYVYQDSLQPLDVQPNGPPPVAEGMPMWEFVGTSTNRNMGSWELGDIPSTSNELHWLSAWHYSLDGNGISPAIRVGDTPNTERESVWVTNSEWVPTLNFGVPNAASDGDAVQRYRMFNGNRFAPRRWLTAIEGYTQNAAPTYPQVPGANGPDEIATAYFEDTTSSWSTAITFGLSRTSSFSTQIDPLGVGTVHTLASIYQSDDNHIDITFTKTPTTQGVISIDVYSGGMLLNSLDFGSIYFDREDQIRMVISNSPEEFGATLLVTRNGYGLKSDSILGGGTTLIPTQLRLSNATRTVVEPLQWFAIHFSPTQALTASERQTMVQHSYMFERLDAPTQEGADFDGDGDVDGRDFLLWQRGYGISQGAAHGDGDANLDGRVDGQDLAVWQDSYGSSGEITVPSADFNHDSSIDGDDLAIWQDGYGTLGGGTQAQGDANDDGNVDGRDFLLWQRQINSTGAIADVGTVASMLSDSDASDGQVFVLVEADVAGDELSFLNVSMTQNTGAVSSSINQMALGEIGSGLSLTQDFWLPMTPVFNVAGSRESLDEQLMQELMTLEKYSAAAPTIAKGFAIETSETVICGAIESEDDPQAWDLSADLAIEEWHAF